MLCEETIHKGSAVSCEKVSLHGHNVKETVEGLERLLSGQAHWLVLQKIRVQCPALTWRLTVVCHSSSSGI